MAQGPGDHPPAVAGSPEAIRQEMARTRAALSEGLAELKRRLFQSIEPRTTGDSTNMAKKTTAKAAPKKAAPKKAAAKTLAKAKAKRPFLRS